MPKAYILNENIIIKARDGHSPALDLLLRICKDHSLYLAISPQLLSFYYSQISPRPQDEVSAHFWSLFNNLIRSDKVHWVFSSDDPPSLTMELDFIATEGGKKKNDPRDREVARVACHTSLQGYEVKVVTSDKSLATTIQNSPLYSKFNLSVNLWR